MYKGPKAQCISAHVCNPRYRRRSEFPTWEMTSHPGSQAASLLASCSRGAPAPWPDPRRSSSFPTPIAGAAGRPCLLPYPGDRRGGACPLLPSPPGDRRMAPAWLLPHPAPQQAGRGELRGGEQDEANCGGGAPQLCVTRTWRRSTQAAWPWHSQSPFPSFSQLSDPAAPALKGPCLVLVIE